MDQSFPEQMFDHVSKSVDASKNPWLLYYYFDIATARPRFEKDPSLKEWAEFEETHTRTDTWIPFQKLILEFLDNELKSLCERFMKMTGKLHDLLGPFNTAIFEHYIQSFDDPESIRVAFCHFLKLRLSMSCRMDFIPDSSITAAGRFRISNRLRSLDERNRLMFLSSLILNQNETANVFSEQWLENTTAEVAEKWWELSERGEMGWPELPDFLLDRYQNFPQVQGNFILRNLRHSRKGATAYSELVKLSQTEDGRLIWPVKRWDRQQLAYVLYRMIGQVPNPIIESLHTPWQQATRWFVYGRGDGSNEELNPKSLHTFAQRLQENPNKIDPEIAAWFPPE